MSKTTILLPEKIVLLRNQQTITTSIVSEEYAMYFENFIFPLYPEYDIVIDCKYGGNFGKYWSIKNFPNNIDSFPFSIHIYNEWGVRVAEQSCTIELVESNINSCEFNILCIGDSMTHRQHYIDHLTTKIPNLRTLGTRSFNGITFHEGRGGWQLEDYMTRYADWRGGQSPFIFPKNISGEDYYGDKSFNTRLKTPNSDHYVLDGYQWQPINEGQFFHDGGSVWQSFIRGDVLIDMHPDWEFSFSKYIKRFNIKHPDAVSVLLAANDLQGISYEDGRDRVDKFMNRISLLVNSIHEFDASVDVILNLPISGAEQYAWGLRGNDSAKRYKRNTMLLCSELLRQCDKQNDKHIHICPMRLFVDPEYSFESSSTRANKYSEALIQHHCNWVHPNMAGYHQMGDILAAMIVKLQNDKKKNS